MKDNKVKRCLSILLVLAIAFSSAFVMGSALAREDDPDYLVRVQGRLDTGQAYMGRASYFVAFQVKTANGKKIANAQTLSLAYDTDLFEVGGMGGEIIIPNKDLSSTAWTSADELAAAYTGWTAKLNLRLSADGRTGYADMEPYRNTGLTFTGLSLPEYGSVETVRLVFKEGKSFDDMKTGSVRLMTVDELLATNLSNIAGVSDGTVEYSYGLATRTPNTLREPTLDLQLPATQPPQSSTQPPQNDNTDTDNPPPLAWLNPYIDVKNGDWFYDAVRFATMSNLMNGTAADKFSPNMPVTRAMMVTILYRLEGRPTVTGSIPYSDIKSGQWYTDAVIWAAENDIVYGYPSGIFGWNDVVSREQLATILYRYAMIKELDLSASDDLSKYTDTNDISTWARPAIKWIVAEGIIQGRTSTTVVPKGSATRAEVAMIYKRFIEDFLGENNIEV